MRQRSQFSYCGWLWFVSIVAAGIQARAAEKIDFNRDIKPLLSNNCYFCHGPDEAERRGGTDGLRIDTFDGATADLGGYAAIVPGKPEESELITRITSSDPDTAMPPAEMRKKLSPREIELITEWVRQGARYETHWSYVKPLRHELPAVQDASWPKNEIDRFILARLERERLKPSLEADRHALIRRLSLDLTGLPPTIDEVNTFVDDKDPRAYEKLVDRLLAKPAYGEHWAHMWLDLARYADSAGYADDGPRTIWAYRDYVIRSLNNNQPFDQFTIEQIAGDLLPNATLEQRIATAFHRNTLTNSEGGTNDEEFRNVAIVDRVNTTMAVWMGTTIACAQCHSHKYDPLTQEEFFKLFAIFNSTEDADRQDESPVLTVVSPEHEQQRTGLQAELATLEHTLRTPTPELLVAQQAWEASLLGDANWHTPKPLAVSTQTGAVASISDDSSIHVTAKAANDNYTVEVPLEAMALRALRLEVLPDDALPNKGPGHANGNFVLSRLTASVIPPHNVAPAVRYVRVELPGQARFLSLAEVQVFAGNRNVAIEGEASQLSTDYDGPARLAIDGNTDGNFFGSKSVTHTALANDPWWEVDLKTSQPVDRIVIWNRMDGGTAERLSNYRVRVFNERKEPLWERTIAEAPKPSDEFSLSGERPVALATANADYSQPDFGPESVVSNANPRENGWAIGGQIGQSHVLTVSVAVPLEIPSGSKLQVVLDHASKHANHTLGRFRLSVSDDPRAADRAKLPAAVVAALAVAPESRTPAQRDVVTQQFLATAQPLQPTRNRIAEIQKGIAAIPTTTVPVMKELANRRVTYLQHRGNFLDVGPEVKEGTPAVFPPLPSNLPPNRLALARWLMDESNPLTARVIANRYWEQIFGIGIVSTSEEFGSQGDLPFHPELLDWLATELVRLKWDRKAFVRLLVTSAAYRQSSKSTPELNERDPDNRLLARGPRVRLSAEMIRDQALTASGLLSPRMFGAPVKPPQPSSGLSAAFGGGIDWQTSAGEDRYRRALYTTWRRSNPYPSMSTFDAPNREVCTVRRIRTNTPLQALVTLNDPVYVEAAQALARRAISEGGATAGDRAGYAFRLCLARPAETTERDRLVTLFEKTRSRFEKDPDAARKLATDPLGPAPAGMDVAELAAWTVVGNVLLNLDETLMKR